MLELHAVAEPQPGARFRERFEATWPAYRAWYLRDGDAARPSYLACRHALEFHMPELVPTYERITELAGGGDLAARMLSLYDPPPLVTGCSQAVLTHPEPLLVRNYDFDPTLLEGVVVLSAYTGRRVLGMSDCLWGLLDGVNDAGLAMSLAFGGRRVTAPGFAMPLIVRYLLELCATTREAVAVLARLPVQASYNLTIVDREGDATTAHVAPDRPVEIGRALVATNHQRTVEWPEHAEAVRSEERERCMLELLDAGAGEEEFVAAFLEPPLYSTAYAEGFGTLYTATYRPVEGAVDLRWPDATWRQAIGAFEEGTLSRSRSSRA
ncbi:MAG TPA: C45 family peptidase [Solirubrobacteraceae bacterium]|nr:C45 family peptidase [Solirubrobacteraceae bacterium]